MTFDGGKTERGTLVHFSISSGGNKNAPDAQKCTRERATTNKQTKKAASANKNLLNSSKNSLRAAPQKNNGLLREWAASSGGETRRGTTR